MRRMERARRRLLVLPLWGISGALRAAGATPGGPDAPTPVLRLGLAPFLSPQALLTAFASLRAHLVRTLGSPVELYTARDFRSLLEGARRGDYEIVLLPGHLAALLALDDGWLPLARTAPVTEVLVLVRADGPVQAAAGLRGRPVGMLDALSLAATVGTAWLRRQSLGPEDTPPLAMTSINSALLALQRDEVAAVVATETQLATMPPSLTAATRVLARLDRIPGPLYMARPGTTPAQRQRWLAAMSTYEPDKARPLTAANSRPSPLTNADLAPLAPYAELARRQLAAPR